MAMSGGLARGWHAACVYQVGVLGRATKGPACRRVSDRIGVVIPSEQLRRRIVARLAVLGYYPRTVGSLKEAMDLVAAHDIDTLVLHVSSFSTEVLSRFGRMMSGRKTIAFIASVSVVSAADGSRGNGADRSAQVTGGFRRSGGCRVLASVRRAS